MALLDLDRLTDGLGEGPWGVLLRDWESSLRAANHPETTRYNYLLAAAQFARFLADSSGDWDPAAVQRKHVEAFQISMIETRSAATALNKHKALQQFFRWLVEEGEIEQSPMVHVRQPKVVQKVIPVISDQDTRRLLEACAGNGFAQLRDQALIRMYANTGAWLSEIGGLLLTDVDLNLEAVCLHGKGGKDRWVRLGPKTARVLRRYLRSRARRTGAADVAELWLAERGVRSLRPNGIKIRLKRLGERAGVGNVYAHRWRHSYAHEWKLQGADTGDLMLILGWSSDETPRRYGASAAAERAQQVPARLGIGERV
jgi:integrase/recombinase XerC